VQPIADLVLVPTQFELSFCREVVAKIGSGTDARVEVCGWGPIESAVGATGLISALQPRRTWLIGIAGGLSEEAEIGRAYEFSQAAIDGIGVGSRDSHVAFTELGWNQKFGGLGLSEPTLELGQPQNPHRQLLTVCSVSGDQNEAEERRRKYPEAMAEDMETYSVALACRATQTSLRVVRGISNRAGQRDHTRWVPGRAMMAAFELAGQLAGWKAL
jgi:futalosine hydrolase